MAFQLNDKSGIANLYSLTFRGEGGIRKKLRIIDDDLVITDNQQPNEEDVRITTDGYDGTQFIIRKENDPNTYFTMEIDPTNNQWCIKDKNGTTVLITGSGIVDTLAELKDVAITNLQNNDIFFYDFTTAKWKNYTCFFRLQLAENGSEPTDTWGGFTGGFIINGFDTTSPSARNSSILLTSNTTPNSWKSIVFAINESTSDYGFIGHTTSDTNWELPHSQSYYENSVLRIASLDDVNPTDPYHFDSIVKKSGVEISTAHHFWLMRTAPTSSAPNWPTRYQALTPRGTGLNTYADILDNVVEDVTGMYEICEANMAMKYKKIAANSQIDIAGNNPEWKSTGITPYFRIKGIVKKTPSANVDINDYITSGDVVGEVTFQIGRDDGSINLADALILRGWNDVVEVNSPFTFLVESTADPAFTCNGGIQAEKLTVNQDISTQDITADTINCPDINVSSSTITPSITISSDSNNKTILTPHKTKTYIRTDNDTTGGSEIHVRSTVSGTNNATRDGDKLYIKRVKGWDATLGETSVFTEKVIQSGTDSVPKTIWEIGKSDGNAIVSQLTLDGDGNLTVTGTTSSSGHSTAGPLITTSTTDATGLQTGALQSYGGCSISKQLWTGDLIHAQAGIQVTGANIITDQIIQTINSIPSTSMTTGSVVSEGGIGANNTCYLSDVVQPRASFAKVYINTPPFSVVAGYNDFIPTFTIVHDKDNKITTASARYTANKTEMIRVTADLIILDSSASQVLRTGGIYCHLLDDQGSMADRASVMNYYYYDGTHRKVESIYTKVFELQPNYYIETHVQLTADAASADISYDLSVTFESLNHITEY